MKKVISLLSSLFIILVIQGNELSYNPDSLNIRHYEDQYLLPGIMDTCDAISLDIIPSEDSIYFYHNIWNRDNDCRLGDWIPNFSTNEVVRFYGENLLTDYAQPYYTDSSITIVGLSGYVYNENYFYCDYCEASSSFDTNYYFYLELRDYSLTHVIKSIDITDREFGDTQLRQKTKFERYTEVFFDSPVNINGKFYVVFHTPDTVFDKTSDKRIDLMCAIYATAFCNTDMLPLKRETKYGNWEFVTTDGTGVTPENVKTVTMLYLFPILSEYNPNAEEWHGVGLNETRDISNFTHVFPNPAKEEVNINCGYKIKTLQVYDEQGKVLLEKEVNAYNYQINLNSLPQGTYFIKVITNSGQTVKKIIRN